MLRLSYYPLLWKFAQIIMIPKPGKAIHDASSYRPISLLPTLSKIFDKLLLQLLRRVVDLPALLPEYQFGFRAGHSTVHQTHRIVNEIAKVPKKSAFAQRSFSMSLRHSIKSGISVCYINLRPCSLARIICS
jgi:hypothetical protein